VVAVSVVAGSESGTGRIRNSKQDPDPEKIFPDPDSSGSEMKLKQNYSEKLIKFDNFSTKVFNLKI
jgi:hypothetical protein